MRKILARFLPKLLPAVFIWLTAAVFPVYAVTVKEYKEYIAHLKGDVTALIEDDWQAGERKTFEREVFAEFRRLASENRVEFQGATIETDNYRFSDKIDRLEKTPTAERTPIYVEIYEMLSALEWKLDELDNSKTANALSKDEEKRKLAEILQREEFRPPAAKEESFIERKYREFKEWLAEKFPRPEIPEGATEAASSLSAVLQIVIYAVVLGIVGFLIYRFAPFLFGKLRRREKSKKRERVILGERILANEDAQTLFDEAENLAKAGDLRQAIRKGYIALLCELSDRKILGLARHKTNRDYLRDVRRNGEIYDDVRGLTENYEQHWYGAAQVEKGDWEQFKNGYRKAVGNK